MLQRQQRLEGAPRRALLLLAVTTLQLTLVWLPGEDKGKGRDQERVLAARRWRSSATHRCTVVLATAPLTGLQRRCSGKPVQTTNGMWQAL